MKIGYWNINGLAAHEGQLREHLRGPPRYDVFAVGEANVKKGAEAPQFEGFEAPLVFSSTSCEVACRGTVVYVNGNEINYGMIGDSCSSNYKGREIEVFLLKIVKKKKATSCTSAPCNFCLSIDHHM